MYVSFGIFSNILLICLVTAPLLGKVKQISQQKQTFVLILQYVMAVDFNSKRGFLNFVERVSHHTQNLNFFGASCEAYCLLLPSVMREVFHAH